MFMTLSESALRNLMGTNLWKRINFNLKRDYLEKMWKRTWKVSEPEQAVCKYLSFYFPQ